MKSIKSKDCQLQVKKKNNNNVPADHSIHGFESVKLKPPPHFYIYLLTLIYLDWLWFSTIFSLLIFIFKPNILTLFSTNDRVTRFECLTKHRVVR